MSVECAVHVCGVCGECLWSVRCMSVECAVHVCGVCGTCLAGMGQLTWKVN